MTNDIHIPFVILQGCIYSYRQSLGVCIPLKLTPGHMTSSRSIVYPIVYSKFKNLSFIKLRETYINILY